jgi:hypothetical protein
MHDLPLAVFSPENAGHPQRDRAGFLAAANLGIEALDLEDVSEVAGPGGTAQLLRRSPRWSFGPLKAVADLLATLSGHSSSLESADITVRSNPSPSAKQLARNSR